MRAIHEQAIAAKTAGAPQALRRAALGCLLTLAGCAPAAAPPAAPPEQPLARRVTVVPLQVEPWPEAVRVQGSLLAYDDAIVGSKLAGRVAEVAVDLGDRVRQGQLLVQLVRSELDLRVDLAQAQLRQACATLGIEPADDELQFDPRTAPGVMLEQALVNEARSELDRAEQLLASQAVTEAEYNTLQAELKAAEARYDAALNQVDEQVALVGVRRTELALAEQAVKDSAVAAPFDGVVGDRLVSPGEYVAAGQPVASLVRADRLRFTAGVPESRAAAVRPGQTVRIFGVAPGGEPLLAQVSRVSPRVSAATRSVIIEADVANQQVALQAGLFAEAEIVVDPDAQSLVVPKSAVVRFAGVQKVWLVTDDQARQQTIVTGREDATRLEILGGAPAGALVVLEARDGYDGPVIAERRAAAAVVDARSQNPESPPPEATTESGVSTGAAG